MRFFPVLHFVKKKVHLLTWKEGSGLYLQLLNRREIDRIFGRTTIKGQTCIPLSVYLKGNRIKVEIALAKGKRLYDKRQAEKAKLMDKEAREAIGRSRG